MMEKLYRLQYFIRSNEDNLTGVTETLVKQSSWATINVDHIVSMPEPYVSAPHEKGEGNPKYTYIEMIKGYGYYISPFSYDMLCKALLVSGKYIKD